MKRIIIFCCIIISACNSNTIYQEPVNLIPKDSMVMLLTDLYLSSAARNVRTLYDTKNESYVPLVFEKYHIDSSRFYESNNYYTSKIEAYGELLKEVKEIIQIQHDSFKEILDVQDSIKRAEKLRKKDSIKKAKIKKRVDSLKVIEKAQDSLKAKDTIKKIMPKRERGATRKDSIENDIIKLEGSMELKKIN